MLILRQITFSTFCLLSLAACQSTYQSESVQDKFFARLQALCSSSFSGQSSFPNNPDDAFHGKTLVAYFENCDAQQIRIPFRVGTDTSRTWIIRRVEGGLELKHDHRHADGSPDEVTMYGGTTTSLGSELSQSFPADDYTAKLIPAAATNQWSITLTANSSQLTYYLERHGQPRFKATLQRVAD